MSALTANIEGIGLLGPGLDGGNAAAVLTGRSPYVRQPTIVPIPEGLPPAERRRLGLVVKLALNVGLRAIANAGVEADALPAVFASSGGDGQNCHEICQGLANDERSISPTRFHNSVHNVAACYWSIANGARAPSNSLCAYDASFAAGLLESLTQVVVEGGPNLLIAYDSQYPEPLFSKRPIPDAFGIALLLSPERRPGSLARLTASLTDIEAQTLVQPELEKLRATIPAARGLPLLQSIAVRRTSRVVLEYLEGLQVAIEIAAFECQ